MNRHIISKNKYSGTSLIEVMLYIVIVSVMVTVISVYFSTIMVTASKTNTVKEVDDQAELISEQISKTIYQASAINSPVVGTPASSLSVNNYDIAKDPTIFDLSGGYLRIKEGTGTNINLSSNKVIVSNLIFTNMSSTGTKGIVRYQFTLTHVNPNNRKEFNYSQTYYGSVTLH